jgi:hypothetical protein
MCKYSGRLIAWLDHELPDEEATNVEWHVGQCGECRKAVDAYAEIGGAFLPCYEAAMAARLERHFGRWAAVFGAAAAALLVGAALWWQSRSPRVEQLVLRPPSLEPAPLLAFQRPVVRRAAVHPKRPAPVPGRQWIAPEPTVQVVLPADALFPPGAVPAGFSFIADVRP